jgi:hypothetical protein
MMNHPNNFDNQAIDTCIDSMLSLDDDISTMNMFAVPNSTDTATVQPVTIGITQISPNGTNDDMVRTNEFTYIQDYTTSPTYYEKLMQHSFRVAGSIPIRTYTTSCHITA